MSKNKHSMKNIFMTFILLVIMYKIVRNPNQSINSAREGLNLWFNLLIPSLYPLIFITDLLVSFGIRNSITKYFDPLMVSIFNVPGIGAFPFSMSIMSGYPIGARLTSKLRKERYISKIDADRLISFSSTSGPLFILGTVLIGMMGGPNVSALMIIPHYLGAITVGVIFRFYKRKDSLISTNNYQYNNRSHLDKEALENKSVGSLIYKSIKDSMESIISIGGFVIIYSVIIDILLSFQLFNSLVGVISQLTSIDANIIKGIIAGIIEMTNGCEIISNLNIDLIIKVIILNLIIGWGGFSIHSQALSFISSTDISPKIYLISKFLHGIFSAIYTYVLYLLFYKNITMKTYINSMPTFNTYTSNNFVKLFIISTSIVIVSTICLSLLNVFINECRKRA